MAFSKKIRFRDTRRKFLFGLSFERSGLDFVNNDYLNSEEAFQICQLLLKEMNASQGLEHQFYKLGEGAFHSKEFMEKDHSSEELQTYFGNHWKKFRYHNLVRLGADILRSELAEYSKATVLGALLWYADQHQKKLISKNNGEQL